MELNRNKNISIAPISTILSTSENKLKGKGVELTEKAIRTNPLPNIIGRKKSTKLEPIKN